MDQTGRRCFPQPGVVFRFHVGLFQSVNLPVPGCRGLAAAAASAAAAAEGLTPNAQNGHQGRVGDEENLEEDSRCRGPLEWIDEFR